MKNSITRKAHQVVKILCAKKRQTFRHFTQTVNSAWPAEPTFLIPTLLMDALRVTLAEPASLYCTVKQELYFFADILPVNISISLL